MLYVYRLCRRLQRLEERHQRERESEAERLKQMKIELAKLKEEEVVEKNTTSKYARWM